MIINPAPIVISPTSAPNGTVGQAYSQTFVASGGAGGPYDFSNYQNVPPGLSFSLSGGHLVLSGTPTTQGTYATSFVVTDGAGNQQTFSI